MARTNVTSIHRLVATLVASLLALVFAAPAGAAPSTVIASGATAVSAGVRSACARMADGTVRCWGMNAAGQLGDGTTVDSSVPVAVSGITGAAAVSVGENFGCSLLEDGTVECWGVGSWGELGDGNGDSSAVPVKVTGLAGAVAIDAGNAHSCAALGDGSVWCWGEDLDGQLGDDPGGYTLAQFEPVQAKGLTGAVSVGAGLLQSCAGLASGGVQCWGVNNAGQLGAGSPIWEERTPTAVTNLDNVAAVAAGRYHTCSLLSDGDAYCWGQDWFGQLGDGGSEDRYSPVAVVGLHDAVAISAGFAHTCALLAGGSVECWGENAQGQLGDGTTTNRSTPVAARGIQHALAISAGDDYTCAVLEGGAVECWGGDYGRIEGPPAAPAVTPATAASAPGASVPARVPAQPPTVRITSHPSAETGDPSAPFAFSGVAGGAYECSIDAGPWAACRSGQDFGPLAPGDHRFSVRETLGGVTGPAASYSWTIDLPRACVLRVARARVFAFTHQSRARLVIHYKAYEPAQVTVSYALSGSRGKQSLGTASSRFRTAGTFRLTEKLGSAELAKLRATTSITVHFSIPQAPTSCSRYYTKQLTIPREAFGQTVWFQSDSLFTR